MNKLKTKKQSTKKVVKKPNVKIKISTNMKVKTSNEINKTTEVKNIISSNRPSKIDYYLDIAQQVAQRGTCLRRNYGAVIVNNDHIVSTGYSGAPRGVKNCLDIGECPRQKANIPAGERYELCRSVHAEMNAIIHAASSEMIGSTLYVCGINAVDKSIFGGKSCRMCRRMIINAGIKTVIVREKDNKYTTYNVDDWILEDTGDITKDMNGY